MKLQFSIFKMVFYKSKTYLFNFSIQIVNSLILMATLYFFWKTLIPDDLVKQKTLISYSIYSILLELIFFHTDAPQTHMSKWIKTGTIVNYTSKPFSFFNFSFMLFNADVLIRILFNVIPALILSIFIFDIDHPNSFIEIMYSVSSLILGYLILFNLNFLISTLCIFLVNIDGLEWGYYSIIKFFGGQFIPLYLYPSSLILLINFLPFKYIYYIPIQSFVDSNLETNTMLTNNIIQLIWIVSLIAFNKILWNTSIKKINVQGG